LLQVSLRLQGRSERAARLAARHRARESAGKAGARSKSGAMRPREPAADPAAACLTATADGAAAMARTRAVRRIGRGAATRRVRGRGHPPGAPIVEAEQDYRQGRL